MSINVNIKCSTGTSFSVQTEEEQSIGDFKKLLAEKANIPSEQQRLIYSGHVLKDHQTLKSYGVKDGHTVHLVRGASNNTASQATTQQTQSQQTSTNVPTETQPASPFGFPGFGGFGGTNNLQQVQQQLMSNPQMMREVMNSPMMQSMMQNPELIRSMLMSNPQMREIVERNPEIGHILNDPQTLRQTLEMARNPELMREMMRNTDRAMSNIEAHPEGFNLLRRMYTNVQEPLYNATQPNATQPNAQSNNPFAALFGNNAAGQQGGTQAQTNTQSPANPNTAPLPNPWGTTPATPTQTQGNTTGGISGMNPFGGMGLGLDPNSMNQLLQNPMIQDMMQQVFSNPEMMQQMFNSNPMLQQMMAQNPMMQQMMSNPELMRQLYNPQTLNALLQMQSAMQTLQNTGLFGSMFNPQGVQTGSTPNAQPQGTQPQQGVYPDLGQLFSMMGGPTQAASGSQEPPEVRFRVQLEQLGEMGFTDQASNIRALQATSGNVQLAIERLLSGL